MQTIANTHGEIKTKADRIRVMLFHGFSPAEIAAEIGCSSEYVRATRNRLRNKLQTGRASYPNERILVDAAYREKRSKAISAWFAERYRSDSEFRERCKTKRREHYRRRRAAKAEAAL